MRSLRGRDVVGDHTVGYVGNGERLGLTHKAAIWARNQSPGPLQHGKRPWPRIVQKGSVLVIDYSSSGIISILLLGIGPFTFLA